MVKCPRFNGVGKERGEVGDEEEEEKEKEKEEVEERIN